MNAGRQSRNSPYPSWVEYPSALGAEYNYHLFGPDTTDQEAMFISHAIVVAGVKVKRPIVTRVRPDFKNAPPKTLGHGAQGRVKIP